MNTERGIVLIIVLWTMLVLMMLAAELAQSSRIEGRTASVYQQDATAYYLATAGIHRAMYRVLRAQQQGLNLLTLGGVGQQFGQPRGGLASQGGQTQQSEEEQDVWLRGDGRWKKEEFGEGGYWVRVIDEGGKINLNQVDETTLRQTFANLGFDQEMGELLTDAIQDWRDTDPLVRLHGAENDYYQGLPIPYPAKDGPFDSLDELMLIRGVTPALFYGKEGPALQQIFTVYSGGGGGMVNLLTANPLVLRAVLGVDADAARDLVQRRSEATGANLSGLFPGGGGRGLNFGIPQVVTIESVGYLNDAKTTHRVGVVVQRLGVNGFRFLRWRDRVDGGEPVPTEVQ